MQCDKGVVAEDPAEGGTFGWGERGRDGVEVNGEEFEGGLGKLAVAFRQGERGVAALDEKVCGEESVLELGLEVLEMRQVGVSPTGEQRFIGFLPDGEYGM